MDLIGFEIVFDKLSIPLEIGKSYSFGLPTTGDNLECISDLLRISLERCCRDELHSRIYNRICV